MSIVNNRAHITLGIAFAIASTVRRMRTEAATDAGGGHRWRRQRERLVYCCVVEHLKTEFVHVVGHAGVGHGLAVPVGRERGPDTAAVLADDRHRYFFW